jgi:hypothetical protein
MVDSDENILNQLDQFVTFLEFLRFRILRKSDNSRKKHWRGQPKSTVTLDCDRRIECVGTVAIMAGANGYDDSRVLRFSNISNNKTKNIFSQCLVNAPNRVTMRTQGIIRVLPGSHKC